MPRLPLHPDPLPTRTLCLPAPTSSTSTVDRRCQLPLLQPSQGHPADIPATKPPIIISHHFPGARLSLVARLLVLADPQRHALFFSNFACTGRLVGDAKALPPFSAGGVGLPTTALAKHQLAADAPRYAARRDPLASLMGGKFHSTGAADHNPLPTS
jgi:hypothetical protein